MWLPPEINPGGLIMVRVAGVDPGTGSFDVCILEDGSFIHGETLPTGEVFRRPELLVECLVKAGPLDLIAGPSGHGLPLKPLSQAGGSELRLAALVKSRGAESVLGLRRVLGKLKSSGLPVVMLPSVKYLPTVPVHRKINRIDLGTADKLCVAALGIADQAERLGSPFSKASFILAELGFAFTALLAVRKGAVIAGLGGTVGSLGFLSPGGLDGEVAYLLGKVSKKTLTGGGAFHASGLPKPEPEKLASEALKGEPQCRAAWEAYMEGLTGNVAYLAATTGKPREILVSGRLSRIEPFFAEASRRLERFAPVRRLEGFTGKVKQAAQGAALLADGLAGGKYEGLIECLRLREARGTLLDHVYLEGFSKVKRRMLRGLLRG